MPISSNGRGALKFLRTRLGRVIRDIRRKTAGNPALGERFAELLALAAGALSGPPPARPQGLCAARPRGRMHRQGQGQIALRVWLQGVGGDAGDQTQEPALAKAGGGQFVLHTKALHGNPFDGHTLGPVVAELEQLTGVETRRIHVDKGYRGHNHPHKFRVWITGQAPAGSPPRSTAR